MPSPTLIDAASRTMTKKRNWVKKDGKKPAPADAKPTKKGLIYNSDKKD